MKIPQNLYACAYCEESFPTASALVSHVQNKHISLQPTKIKNENANEKEKIKGKVGKPLFNKCKIYKTEETENDSKSYKSINEKLDVQNTNHHCCKKCDKTYSTANGLYR